MYDFVSHTWNTVKGACFHSCSYCYMKRWGPQRVARFDEKELKTDLGSGNFIFVGSSNDLFARNNPEPWIIRTLEHCSKFDNQYLFQTKDPGRLECYVSQLPTKSVVCTTIETNRYYVNQMVMSPLPWDRANWLNEIAHRHIKTYVTIEPIMKFDLDEMAHHIETCLPEQVNIGADTGRNNLPEPSREEVLALIEKLEAFTTVKQKKNLSRILNP